MYLERSFAAYFSEFISKKCVTQSSITVGVFNIVVTKNDNVLSDQRFLSLAIAPLSKIDECNARVCFVPDWLHILVEIQYPRFSDNNETGLVRAVA